MMQIDMVPNSKILFSSYSKISQVCPSDDDEAIDNINVGELCQEDISCTMFEKIEFPFIFRSEQCTDVMYVLMVYPKTSEDPEDTMSIYAEYADNSPWYTVTGGVHEIINTETQWGERSADLCESTIRCSLVTCQYTDDLMKNETICMPRATSTQQRDEYCSRSGLIAVDYGSVPLDEYSTWAVILLVAGFFLLTWFCAGCYYNFRIYQNKRAPFRVPSFWPQCCFPQPKDDYNYSFDQMNDSQGSLDILDGNQARNSTKRGTTRYRAPQFYFEDD